MTQRAGVPQVVQRYFEHCHRRVYPPNATIITAGDLSNQLFFLVRGSVSVVIEDDDGHEMVLAYLHEGDIFGEIGMFDEKHERSAWVRARTRTEVAQIGYEQLRTLARESPEIIFEMLGQLSLRVRDTSRKVGDLAFRDVAGRIARALKELCEQPDAKHTPHGTELRLTRLELGRIVGCSREMASRVLRNLEERGLISVAGKRILVHRRR